MSYLLGAVGCAALFVQSYKFSVARGYDVDWVTVSSFAFNVLLLLLIRTASHGAIAWPAIWLGVGFGLAGGLAQFAFFRALRYGALSVSWTVVQLSMLMPVLASILFWGEHPTLWQRAAIGGVALAVVLMGDVELRRLRCPLAWASWLSLSYVTSGLSAICMKALGSMEEGGSKVAFLLVGYTVSALLMLPLVRGRRLGLGEAVVGIVRGLAILSANYLQLKAIGILPGYLVFAAYSAAGVTINVLAAILIWSERPPGRVVVGIVLAITAIVGLNL